jgi:hypothetical protein
MIIVGVRLFWKRDGGAPINKVFFEESQALCFKNATATVEYSLIYHNNHGL